MDDSILATIKKMLGLAAEYTAFDQDIIVLINSQFMALQQLGVGTKDKHGFAIKDYSEKWKDFLVNDVNLRAVKEYIYMKVRMVFDPPGNSFVMDAYKQQCQELEWRLNVQAESVETFNFINDNDGFPRLG